MSRDDLYRRDEQRRAEMRAEESRRECRRQEMLREQRRGELLRDEQRREERRREERRQEAIRDEERRRRRADDEKAQDENRKRGMSLLRDGFTDWGAAVLGLEPKRTRYESVGEAPAGGQSAPPRPSDRSSGPSPESAAPQRLPAPLLWRFGDIFTGTAKLSWAAVPVATGYVLEESLGPKFAFATEIYRGNRTEHVLADRLGLRLTNAASAPRRCYRVKATAGSGFLDSPWSSVA